MKKYFLNWFACLLFIMAGASCMVSCDDDNDAAGGAKELDGTLYGEWVESSGNHYVFDYYYFSSNGTGIHGSYESDIDWVNEDDDIKWYTVNDKYLYINGVKHEYYCNGSTLEITRNGKTKRYHEK